MLLCTRLIQLAFLLGVVGVIAKPIAVPDDDDDLSRGGGNDDGPRMAFRKEWRELSDMEKSDYIKAVQCLHALPSKHTDARWPGVVSRFDDFVLTHILHTPDIHFNGQFLPWHRYFTRLHERALRKECGYRGYQPYWNALLDLPPNGNFIDSPVFAAELGFGGNGAPAPIPEGFVFYGGDMSIIPLDGSGTVPDFRGNRLLQPVLPALAATRTGGGCIVSGPFKDLPIRLGPANALGDNTRCLIRDFTPSFVESLNLPEVVKALEATDSYVNLTDIIELAHGVGHGGVGGILGEMINLFSSPNDPLFFLHHSNIDRIWWNWQNANPSVRFSQVAGPAYGSGDEQVSPDFNLELSPIAKARPIKDFFDIKRLGYNFR